MPSYNWIKQNSDIYDRMEENKEDEITDCKREIDILKRNVLELQDQLRNAYIIYSAFRNMHILKLLKMSKVKSKVKIIKISVVFLFVLVYNMFVVREISK
mgnify:CR=1 FL=1